MSEEEISEIIKKYEEIAYVRGIREDEKGKNEDYFVMEKMLNLYEQERKKNKELELNYDKLTRHFIENHISKDKIKEIVDNHILKKPNIITGKMEYTPSINANSFVVQDILDLLEEK